MKKCAKCQETKPKTEYHKNSTTEDGLTNYCKPCKNDYNKRYRGNRPHVDRMRKYGVCEQQWDIMMKRCGGKCELCGGDNGPKKSLCVDHNHETGEVRGLLCSNCNQGLGYLKDSAELIKKAATYLEERGQYGI